MQTTSHLGVPSRPLGHEKRPFVDAIEEGPLEKPQGSLLGLLEVMIYLVLAFPKAM